MHAKLRKVMGFVLVLSVLAVGTAQEAPAAQQVVERFVEALSAGRITTAVGLLGSNATWSEHDLFWRTSSGTDAQIRVNQLVRADVQIETEVLAVLGHGQVVIASERMWGDFVPEGMAPLRSTTVYVVESGWLVGITRVLSAEQRDALTLATVADTAWDDGADTYHRFDADGTYRNFDGIDDLRADRDFYFSGTYRLERGVLTFVADADSRVCNPVVTRRLADE
ncbi:MAG: hypothetical protein P1P87_08860 [Trueperaceae bacterium]|nr:hypothetical protein [Trueperaceae bacterium]